MLCCVVFWAGKPLDRHSRAMMVRIELFLGAKQRLLVYLIKTENGKRIFSITRW